MLMKIKYLNIIIIFIIVIMIFGCSTPRIDPIVLDLAERESFISEEMERLASELEKKKEIETNETLLNIAKNLKELKERQNRIEKDNTESKYIKEFKLRKIEYEKRKLYIDYDKNKSGKVPKFDFKNGNLIIKKDTIVLKSVDLGSYFDNRFSTEREIDRESEIESLEQLSTTELTPEELKKFKAEERKKNLHKEKKMINYFFNLKDVKTISFEKDCKLFTIEKDSFENMTNLRKVSLPKSLKFIGREAFGKLNLTEVIFEEGIDLIEIENWAFYECKINKVDLKCNPIIHPVSFTNINIHKQYPEYPVTQVNLRLNDKQKTILNNNYNQCSEKTITIDKNIEEIENNKYYNCKHLESIFIPKNIKKIGYQSFNGCEKLKKITFEKGSKLEIIDISAFSDCRLTSITIPKSVKIINNLAFRLNEIQELKFEENSILEFIGNRAFAFNSLSKKISFPNSLKVIDNRAFQGYWKEHSKSLIQIKEVDFKNNSNLILHKKAFDDQQINKSIKKIDFYKTKIVKEYKIELGRELDKEVKYYSDTTKKYYSDYIDIDKLTKFYKIDY